MQIGKKIYLLRTQNGMTLEELGNKVGVGKSTVRKWENGMIANMRRDKILKVAEALNTSPAYLIGWEEEQKIADQFSELVHNDLYSEVFDILLKMNDKAIRRYIKYGYFLIEEQ